MLRLIVACTISVCSAIAPATAASCDWKPFPVCTFAAGNSDGRIGEWVGVPEWYCVKHGGIVAQPTWGRSAATRECTSPPPGERPRRQDPER